MLIDLHTHTYPLSHDSLLSADDLIDAAKRARLDGVCLTEHDFFWERDEAAALARRHGFLIIPGIEVNTEGGHLLVFGLERFVYGMHRTQALASLVRNASGVMIAAHPYRRQLPFELHRQGDPDGQAWSQALDLAAANPIYRHVAAVETHNGRGDARQNGFSRELCRRLALPEVPTSDAHQPDDVGRCATDFQRPIAGLADLIAELKAGRYRAVIMQERRAELL